MNNSLKDVLQACVDTGEERLWQELLTRTKTVLGAVLLRTARKFGASSDKVQDLAQILYLKIFQERERLLRLLDKCPDDQAVLSYFAAIAANVAHDFFKAQNSSKRGGNALVSTQIDPENAPAEAQAEAMERTILIGEIERKIERLTSGSPRDRTIFWLYYRQGFTAQAIASIPAFRLTTKGVESILNRLTRKLREEILPRHPISCAQREGIGSSPAFSEGEELG